MDQKYCSLLGSPQNPVIISLALPRLGQHEFKFVKATEIGMEYFHYGFRLHPKATPVNVHVYGERSLIEYLAKTGTQAVCELELVVKRVSSEREFIFVNLFLTAPGRRPNHEFQITNAPHERPWHVYTTKDMRGVGISVKPL